MEIVRLIPRSRDTEGVKLDRGVAEAVLGIKTSSLLMFGA